MKLFKNQWTIRYQSPGKSFQLPSMTKQGDSVTPADILRSYIQPVKTNPVFLDMDLDSLLNMSIFDRIDYLKDIRVRQDYLKKTITQHQKNQSALNEQLKQKQHEAALRKKIETEIATSKNAT